VGYQLTFSVFLLKAYVEAVQNPASLKRFGYSNASKSCELLSCDVGRRGKIFLNFIIWLLECCRSCQRLAYTNFTLWKEWGRFSDFWQEELWQKQITGYTLDKDTHRILKSGGAHLLKLSIRHVW